MKKQRSCWIFAAVIAVIALFALASCDSIGTPKECVHDYSNWSVTKAADCDEQGVQARTCSKCGFIDEQSISALGHTAVADLAQAATCTQTGLTEGKHCSVCNTVLVERVTIPALGHAEVIDAAKPATCTQTGLTEGKHCSVCNTRSLIYRADLD